MSVELFISSTGGHTGSEQLPVGRQVSIGAEAGVTTDGEQGLESLLAEGWLSLGENSTLPWNGWVINNLPWFPL